jgi:hypothetical protein
MLTRETALARLRTAGTLATGKRSANVITATATANPMVRAAARAIEANRHVTGPRELAPSACQAVLP